MQPNNAEMMTKDGSIFKEEFQYKLFLLKQHMKLLQKLPAKGKTLSMEQKKEPRHKFSPKKMMTKDGSIFKEEFQHKLFLLKQHMNLLQKLPVKGKAALSTAQKKRAWTQV